MAAAITSSLRRLAPRIVFTLVGLVLLYVAGYGPCLYLDIRFNMGPGFSDFYSPLEQTIFATPLGPALQDYAYWWFDLGMKHRMEAEQRALPLVQ